MARRLFVSQELLDEWTAEGKAELEGSLLRIAEEERSFELSPGVHFVSLAAGDDRAKLVGKVKSDAQLQALGAELYMNSVLVGEDAYDVQPGFLTRVASGAPLAKSLAPAAFESTRISPIPAPPGAAAAPAPAAKSREQTEREELAKFLLDNLN